MSEVGQSLYADLPRRLANNNPPSTIPTNSSTTPNRSDLVLVSDTEISILELTICHNSPSGFSEAQKEAKYASLILDLEDQGKVVSNCDLGNWYSRSLHQRCPKGLELIASHYKKTPAPVYPPYSYQNSHQLLQIHLPGSYRLCTLCIFHFPFFNAITVVFECYTCVQGFSCCIKNMP